MAETAKKDEKKAVDLEERRGPETNTQGVKDLDERKSTEPKAMLLAQLAAVDALLDDPEVAAAYARFMRKVALKSELVLKTDLRNDSFNNVGVDRHFYGKPVVQ